MLNVLNEKSVHCGESEEIVDSSYKQHAKAAVQQTEVIRVIDVEKNVKNDTEIHPKQYSLAASQN